MGSLLVFMNLNGNKYTRESSVLLLLQKNYLPSLFAFYRHLWLFLLMKNVKLLSLLIPILLSGHHIANEEYYIDSTDWMIKSADDHSHEGLALITIDDGPNPNTTPDFLDLLDAYDAKAIFFINGYRAENHEELTAEILERGHKIGNHTWHHDDLSELGPVALEREISLLNDWLNLHLDHSPTYFRAPYGVMTHDAEAVVERSGMKSMGWSVNSYDWLFGEDEETIESDAIEIADKTMEEMEHGNIILLHDRAVTLEALEIILYTLHEDIEFVVPDE